MMKGMDVKGNKNIINSYSLSNASAPGAKKPSTEKSSANKYSLIECGSKMKK